MTRKHEKHKAMVTVFLAEKIYCPSGINTCMTYLCNFIDSDAFSKERGQKRRQSLLKIGCCTLSVKNKTAKEIVVIILITQTD